MGLWSFFRKNKEEEEKLAPSPASSDRGIEIPAIDPATCSKQEFMEWQSSIALSNSYKTPGVFSESFMKDGLSYAEYLEKLQKQLQEEAKEFDSLYSDDDD